MIRTTIGVLTFLLAGSAAGSAHAQYIEWRSDAQTDTGNKASVALGWNSAGTPWEVEVHQANSDLGPLWYSAGHGALENGSVVSYGASYATGKWPSVADFSVGTSRVIEVHQTTLGPGALDFMFGTIDTTGGFVTWTSPAVYDYGFHPAVAASGGLVVEVHQADSVKGALWAHFGAKVGYAPFAWAADAVHYDNGANPAATIASGDAGDVVVEVHQANDGVGPLWYHTGIITTSGIAWSANAVQYDYGVNPAVAAVGNLVVEVHSAGIGPSPLWYRTGHLWGTTIQWDAGSSQYDSGALPTIAIDNTAFPSRSLELHQAGTSVSPIWTHAFNAYDYR